MNIKYFLLIILFWIIFFSVTTFAGTLPPKEKLCPKNDCRGPTTIRLIKKDGSVFEQKHEYLYPIVQFFGITILPDEHIMITGKFTDGVLTDIKALSNSNDDIPLITFDFKQDGEQMLLTVENHSKFDIKYNLAMMPLKEGRMLKTSSCPVSAGNMAFESWPFPIYQLLIPKIFRVNIEDKTKCEY